MSATGKGRKRVKGEGVLHGELKKDTVLTLTQTARDNLDALARELGISRSEVVEQFARGMVGLPSDLTKEDRYEVSKSFAESTSPGSRRTRRSRTIQGKKG